MLLKCIALLGHCEMSETGERFCFETYFGVGKVFGTHVCTYENDDTLAFDDALVHDRKQRSIVRLFGSFPEYARPICTPPAI